MSELGCALPHYETTALQAVQAHVLLLSLHDESNCSLFIFGIGEDKDNIIFLMCSSMVLRGFGCSRDVCLGSKMDPVARFRDSNTRFPCLET